MQVNCPRQNPQLVGNWTKNQIYYPQVYWVFFPCWPDCNRGVIKLISAFNGGGGVVSNSG